MQKARFAQTAPLAQPSKPLTFNLAQLLLLLLEQAWIQWQPRMTCLFTPFAFWHPLLALGSGSKRQQSGKTENAGNTPPATAPTGFYCGLQPSGLTPAT